MAVFSNGATPFSFLLQRDVFWSQFDLERTCATPEYFASFNWFEQVKLERKNPWLLWWACLEIRFCGVNHVSLSAMFSQLGDLSHPIASMIQISWGDAIVLTWIGNLSFTCGRAARPFRWRLASPRLFAGGNKLRRFACRYFLTGFSHQNFSSTQ